MSGGPQQGRSQGERAAGGQGPRPPGAFGGGRVEKAKNPTGALRRLVSYLFIYKWQIGAVAFLIIISSVLSLLGPYFVGVAIDRYIKTGDVQGLLSISLVLLSIYFAAWIAQLVQGVLMSRISQFALRQVREDLFTHLQTLSLSFFDRRTQGELMSRLTNDVDTINTAVSQSFTQLVSSTLSLIGIILAMFLLNVWLALGSLTVLPLMIIITAFIGRRTIQGFRGLQANLGKLNGRIEETISGQRVVTSFGRQKAALSEFAKDNVAVRDTGIKAFTYSFVIEPLVNVMSSLGIAVVAGLGGWLAVGGNVTIGLITTFIFYAQNFVQPLRQLASLYNTIQSALAGAERVFETIDEVPEITDKPGAKDLKEIVGDVVFNDVSFSYVIGSPVLKNMRFRAEPGQIVALVGPTGAGKTTMINVLGRFYDIQEGSIKIDGVDIRDVTRSSLRRQLGIVLQDNFLFADKVIENIRYGNLEATDEDCMAAAKLANADQFVSRLPNGYSTVLTERGSNLSQGQRQLLAIARAIIADPKILILDEATSSVDTRTEKRIQEALMRLMKGRTSFVIAHRLSTIRNADQVLVISDGEIIERGTHESLLEQRGFYFNLYMSQFKGVNHEEQSLVNAHA